MKYGVGSEDVMDSEAVCVMESEIVSVTNE
jgi:hypothetical protein